MAIRNLQTAVFSDFRGGRRTKGNLTQMPPEFALIAKNVTIQGDGWVRKRPGYTLVTTLAGRIGKIYDFQRQIDGQQFVIIHRQSAGVGALSWIPSAGGVGVETVLPGAEDPAAFFEFGSNVFAAYGSNGVASRRLVDVAGVLTKFNWGIQAPAAAPAFALAAGTLTNVNGYQYVRCYVSKYTDNQGVTRASIGPPSPFSAYTGQFTNKVVNLSGMVASADAQVTHQWIFRILDTPQNTASVFFFLAEIANATTTYGDSLADASLDQTRQAPFDNFPPPLARSVVEYETRLVLMDIVGQPDTIVASGNEEISLGIPQEAFPVETQFKVPSGIKRIRGGLGFKQSFVFGSEDWWFQIKGNSAATFQKRDKIMQPGPAGRKCLVATSAYLVWLAKDKKIRAWDGIEDSPALEVSNQFAIPMIGQKSMEDLTDAEVQNAELRWYSYGRWNWIMVLANTDGTGKFDWIQLWDANGLTATGYRQLLSDGSMIGLAPSDFFPTHGIASSWKVTVGSKDYMFFGDFTNGKIWRFPDGYQDDGQNYDQAAFGTVWTDLSDKNVPPEVAKNLKIVDLHTDRQDAVKAFQLMLRGADTPDLQVPYTGIPLESVPNGQRIDPQVARGIPDKAGVGLAEWLQAVVYFPKDGNPAGLERITINHRPVYQGTP